MSNAAYITRFSTFFPNDPVENDEMEQYIGIVNNKSMIAKRLVLNKNGIRRRYYALDKSGQVTHTNVEMAANAVKALLDDNFGLSQIDLLSCGTASPEQIMPSHGVMVHGRLEESRNMEVVSFAGSCCTGVQALNYSYLSILAGKAKNAVSVASERLSGWMTPNYFEKESELLNQLSGNPILAFEKEFLRWMLSDGAAAVLVQDKPAEKGFSFRIDWIELTSYANEIETCMYAGADKDAEGNVVGWAQFPEMEWLQKSIFSLKQDTRILEKNIVPLGIRFLKEIIQKRGFNPKEIDWFLPHLSSMYFGDKIKAAIQEAEFNIPDEKWFVNLPEIGNVGSASAFFALDGLAQSGKIKQGDKILLMIPESARFSYAYVLVTVV
jgi:3-oxoacyl-[acyl-carrier-protein] synthase-3